MCFDVWKEVGRTRKNPQCQMTIPVEIRFFGLLGKKKGYLLDIDFAKIFFKSNKTYALLWLC